MITDEIFLRCKTCGAVNKVLKEKMDSGPKCGSCQSLLEITKAPVSVNSANFQQEVIEHPGLVLVDFWSPSCFYCAQMNPLIDQLALEQSGTLKVVKMNVAEDQRLAFQFGVKGVPHFILFNKGSVVKQISGSMSKQDLENWIFSL